MTSCVRSCRAVTERRHARCWPCLSSPRSSCPPSSCPQPEPPDAVAEDTSVPDGGRAEGAVLQEGALAQAQAGREHAEGEERPEARPVAEAKVAAVGRRRAGRGEPSRSFAGCHAPSLAREQRRQHQEDRRPEDRRLADRGRARPQQRLGPSSSRSRAGRSSPASSSAASCATRRRSPSRSRTSSRQHKLPKRGVRLGHREQPDRRPHASRSSASTIRSSSRTRSASARRRCCRSRSRRPCSTTRCSPSGRTRTASPCAACCSSSPTASWSTATSTPAARRASSSSASTSRRSRSCAPSPCRTTRCPARNAAPSSRSRSATTARPSPSRTDASASSRACSSGAAVRSTSRSPARSTCRRARPSRSSARSSLDGVDETPEGFSAEQIATGAGGDRSGSCRPSRGSSSPRSSSTRTSPARSGIGEIALTGGTAHLPGLAAELERLIGVPVRVGDPLVARQGLEEAPRPRAARLARDRDRPGDRGLMRAVNLLPRDEVPKSFAKQAAASCSARCRRRCADHGRPLRAHARAQRVDHRTAAPELEPLNAQLVSMPRRRPGGRVAGRRARSREERRASAPSRAALAERVAWDRVLRRFSLVLPDDVWLASLACRPPAPAGRHPAGRRAAAGSGFTMIGPTYSHERRRAAPLAADGRARLSRTSAPVEHRRPSRHPEARRSSRSRPR